MLCQSLLCEVLLGFLFSALKRQKNLQISWGQSQNRWRWKVLYCTQKLSFGLLKKHFLLVRWYVNSYLFGVFRKCQWAKESDMRYLCTLPVTRVLLWHAVLSQSFHCILCEEIAVVAWWMRFYCWLCDGRFLLHAIQSECLQFICTVH